MRRMRCAHLASWCVVAAVSAMTGSSAQEAVTRPTFRNILRFGVFRNEPRGGTSGCCYPWIKSYESATGFRMSLEHKLGSLVGIDFGITHVKQEAQVHDFGVNFAETFATRSFGFDLLFHPGHAGRHVDYYLGPGIHLVSFGDRYSDLSTVAAPSLRTGLDITFGGRGRWGANIDLQRMYTNVFSRRQTGSRLSKRDTNDYSPLRYGAALALKF